jgi:ZIP family zinc transporter
MDHVFSIIIILLVGPVIGSLIGIAKKPTDRLMYNMLSFAAGVMLTISFFELLPESIALSSTWLVILGLAIGAVTMFGIDKLIPHLHPGLCSQEQGHHLKKTAIYLLIGIFLHNFPEGIAIGFGSVSTLKLSFIIAIAIAIHDIPETICTSAPYYYVSKKRLKSFVVSMITSIPTIIGFLLAFYLAQIIPVWLVGLLIASTAGIMIYISADELIPTSCMRMTNHHTIFSFMAGVVLVLLLELL